MNISSIIKQYFIENKYDEIVESLTVIRNDGVVLFSNSSDEFKNSSIGALASGLWQAANSLNSLLESKTDELDLRLSFDTSNNGLYILPIKVVNDVFYLCSIYNFEINPAKLKMNLRFLKKNLEVLLSDMKNEEDSRSEFLFKNISDEEMDNLFKMSRV